jgi:hypothetical protein
MNPRISILMTIDERFTGPLGVTVTSIVENLAPGGLLDLWILGWKLGAGIRQQLQHAWEERVVCLDADCVPRPGWLRAAVAAMRRWPQAVAVSGRTTYPGRSTFEKALGLLSRCYVDGGSAGEVHLLSTNNMIFRRAVFRAHPLPEDAGPLAYRIVTERLRRNGGALYFEPDMLVGLAALVHALELPGMLRAMGKRSVGPTVYR